MSPVLVPAIALLGIGFAPAGAQAPPAPAARQVTHSENDDPSISPDGRRMVCISLVAGREQLFVRTLDGHEVRQLTTHTVNHEDPAWSPDGRRIAFRRMLGETNSEVFVADRDGTHATSLTNHPAFDGWPSWSPDGRRLAFASNRDGDNQIYVMEADGTGIRLVASTRGRATSPKWSPDGRTLYFPLCQRSEGGYDCEIFAADPPPPAGATPAP